LVEKITDEELKKLEEVAKVAAKFVDAWVQTTLKNSLKCQRSRKYSKYLDELREVMHKHIKPKGLVARHQKVESTFCLRFKESFRA